jgi:hypothetical protein
MNNNPHSRAPNIKEKRRHPRYTAEAKVYFNVIYDVRAKVKFEVMAKSGERAVSQEKIPAISKNVSAEGMCITCSRQLNKGDLLRLEVFLPHKQDPLAMDGEVRWLQELPAKGRFDTGIRLLNINGNPVVSSVYHDGVNEIVWSSVLESVFGDFKKTTQKRYAI